MVIIPLLITVLMICSSYFINLFALKVTENSLWAIASKGVIFGIEYCDFAVLVTIHGKRYNYIIVKDRVVIPWHNFPQ